MGKIGLQTKAELRSEILQLYADVNQAHDEIKRLQDLVDQQRGGMSDWKDLLKHAVPIIKLIEQNDPELLARNLILSPNVHILYAGRDVNSLIEGCIAGAFVYEFLGPAPGLKSDDIGLVNRVSDILTSLPVGSKATIMAPGEKYLNLLATYKGPALIYEVSRASEIEATSAKVRDAQTLKTNGLLGKM